MREQKTDTSQPSIFLGELNSIRSAIPLIPIVGTYIDSTLSMHGQKYVEERLQYLIKELGEEIKQVKDFVIDNAFLQTEEGYDLINKTFIAASKTRQKDKLRLFAKVLRGAYSPKTTFHDPELYIKLIEELSARELEVVFLLYRIKVARDPTISASESGSDAFTLSKKFSQFTKEELEFILPRLEKTGLIKELVGSFLGYGGGVYNPTSLLGLFVKYIENNE